MGPPGGNFLADSSFIFARHQRFGFVSFAANDNLYAVYGTGMLASTNWPMFRHDVSRSGRVGGY